MMSSQPEEGREKCPYGPTTGYTALIIGKTLQQLKVISRALLNNSSNRIRFFLLPDQQMYTASQFEFRSFPDIRRNSPSPTLKTEDAPTRWLNGELIPRNNKSVWVAVWSKWSELQPVNQVTPRLSPKVGKCLQGWINNALFSLSLNLFLIALLILKQYGLHLLAQTIQFAAVPEAASQSC